MAFSIGARPLRKAVGEIEVTLHDPNGTNPLRSIRAAITLTDVDGRPVDVWSGDLKPHLPQAMLNQLAGILDYIRAEAVSKLLE